MAARTMTMVFCYDVDDDRTRRRLAALLESRAVRVQESVFEARLGAREAENLFRAANALIGPDDSLRMYALSSVGLSRSRVAGGAPLPEDGDYWLV